MSDHYPVEMVIDDGVASGANLATNSTSPNGVNHLVVPFELITLFFCLLQFISN